MHFCHWRDHPDFVHLSISTVYAVENYLTWLCWFLHSGYPHFCAIILSSTTCTSAIVASSDKITLKQNGSLSKNFLAQFSVSYYSKTCIKRTAYYIADPIKKIIIKRTPSIKWTPAACLPKFSSHIYCKLNLYSADPLLSRHLRGSQGCPLNTGFTVCAGLDLHQMEHFGNWS